MCRVLVDEVCLFLVRYLHCFVLDAFILDYV
jgi:hypothetical protein